MQEHAKTAHAGVRGFLRQKCHAVPGTGEHQPVQVCFSRCTCGKNFGSNIIDTFPADSNAHPAGMEFAQFLYDALQCSYEEMRGHKLALHHTEEPVTPLGVSRGIQELEARPISGS